jgi:Phosphotransferase enzyme family
MADSEWVAGDMLGLRIPATGGALRVGGAPFLTEAFRASGVLAADNRVVAVTRFEEWPGGSTGRKVLLSVAYGKPAPGLHTDLFVKFSRDFADPIRDRSRHQMRSEVRFASLSRMTGFPIAVPACLFADYHQESGTGILITDRVAFGTGVIERHYGKCLDHEMPEPLEHYEALIRALARLAGSHRAGLLPEGVARQFPFDASALSVGERPPYTARQLQNRVARFGDFAAKFPQLLPKNITSPAFVSQLARDVAHFPANGSNFKRLLHGKPELIALCHWNANVDNAWFWRNAHGELECGLLDWGHVSQMNVAMALWGALSGAEPDLWDGHLDALLALFAAEFRSCGGSTLDVEELKLHLHLYAAMMGLAWLMDAPPLIQAQIPDLADVESRLDPRLRANETARVQLHMLTTFLNLWERQDLGKVLTRLR